MFLSTGWVVVFLTLIATGLIYLLILKSRNTIYKRHIRDVLHQRAEITNFLSIFSRNLESVEEIDQSMSMTSRYIADLVEARSVCIFERDGDYLKAIGLSGLFPILSHGSEHIMTKSKYLLENIRRDKIKIGEGVIGEVAASRESLIINSAQNDPRLKRYKFSVSVNTIMAVPMIKDANVTGVVCAVNSRLGDRPFSSEQFRRLRFITSQVILAQDIVRIYKSFSEQQRINQELELARQIQSSLLTEPPATWKEFEIEAFSRAAKEVSGDFYDFVEIDDDRLLVVVGDACGKGIPACMLMAMTRSFIRSCASSFVSLGAMLGEVNRNLFRDTDPERFVTLGCCLIDRKKNLIEFARAGHSELISFIRGHIRTIKPDGSALGILPDELTSFDSLNMRFDKDMRFLLFTDGITEALNSYDEEFGPERLQQSFKESQLAEESPHEVVQTILKTVDEFSANPESQADDQTLLIIRRKNNIRSD